MRISIRIRISTRIFIRIGISIRISNRIRISWRPDLMMMRWWCQHDENVRFVILYMYMKIFKRTQCHNIWLPLTLSLRDNTSIILLWQTPDHFYCMNIVNVYKKFQTRWCDLLLTLKNGTSGLLIFYSPEKPALAICIS